MAAIGTSVPMSTNAVDSHSRTLSSSSATVPKSARLRPISKAVSQDDNRRFSTIKSVSVSDVATTTETGDLPLKEIPGGYGIPFFGAIRDRLDFQWFQQPPLFYEARRDKYKSTVYRTNVPPGPPFFPDPRVVMLLDQKSYPILFDVSKVEKKNIFTGTYVPSLELTGGYRVLAYLDPSELKHKLLKQFTFEIIKNIGPRVVPEMNTAVDSIFSSWQASLKKDGKVAFASGIKTGTYTMVLKTFTKHDPTGPGVNSFNEDFSTKTQLWLLAQIAPITDVPLPWYLAWFLGPLIELFLHTLRIPPFLVKGIYEKLVNYYREYGTELLDIAEKQIGLDREEAVHNLVFLTSFNCWGGINLFFPLVVKYLGGTSAEYQKELAAEVRQAVKDNGGQLGPRAVANMPLVESAVYECLRIEPPVPYQYAKAKEDLVIQNHEASFQIKKGETLAGYMPTACKDPKVFKDPFTFLPKRFLGEEGKALLKYVLWSNGPQTEEPTVENKHCAGKNLVLLFSHIFVATVYMKYDSFEVDSTQTNLIGLKPSTSV